MRKEMTASQYAKLRGITPAAVSKAMKMGHKLPGIRKIKKFSRFYVLEVNELEAKRNMVAKIDLVNLT